MKSPDNSELAREGRGPRLEQDLENAAERLRRLMRLHLPPGEIRPGKEVVFQLVDAGRIGAVVGRKLLFFSAHNGRYIVRARSRGPKREASVAYFRHGKKVDRPTE